MGRRNIYYELDIDCVHIQTKVKKVGIDQSVSNFLLFNKSFPNKFFSYITFNENITILLQKTQFIFSFLIFFSVSDIHNMTAATSNFSNSGLFNLKPGINDIRK